MVSIFDLVSKNTSEDASNVPSSSNHSLKRPGGQPARDFDLYEEKPALGSLQCARCPMEPAGLRALFVAHSGLAHQAASYYELPDA